MIGRNREISRLGWTDLLSTYRNIYQSVIHIWLGTAPCACLFFKSISLIKLSLLTGGEDRDWRTEADTDVLPAVSATGTSAVIDADTGAVVAVVAAALEVIVAVDVGNRTDDAGTDAVSSVPGLFLFTATVLAGVVATALAERAIVLPGEVEGTQVPLTVTGAVPVAEGTSVTGVLAVVGVAAVGVTEVVTAAGVVITTTGTGADAAGVVVDAGCADVTAATDDISVGERAAAVTAAMAAELLAAALAALVFATLRAFSAVARRCNEEEYNVSCEICVR